MTKNIIQIGCYIQPDYIIQEYIDLGYNVYLIDANLDNYNQIKLIVDKFKNVKVFNLLISDSSGIKKFFIELNKKNCGHFSVNEESVKACGEYKAEVSSIELQSITLKDFCNNNKISSIHHLIMDCESYDAEIIKSINFNDINIEKLTFECMCVKRSSIKIKDLLIYIKSFGFNYFFVNAEDFANLNCEKR
jgi:FkbM family methyltransferase